MKWRRQRLYLKLFREFMSLVNIIFSIWWWPTFRPTSADQHVGPVFFGHEHVGEGKNEGKMLANKFVKTRAKMTCWPTWNPNVFYDSNVEMVEFRFFFYSKWMDIYTCWSDKKVVKANRTSMFVRFVVRFSPAFTFLIF